MNYLARLAEAFDDQITINDVVLYFVGLTILACFTLITFRKGRDLWLGIKGPDGVVQTVEMLIGEYLVIMPAVVVSSVFLKVEVDDNVWSFLKQITIYLLGAKVGGSWITSHYKKKKNKEE
jgi:hypothetical protein